MSDCEANVEAPQEQQQMSTFKKLFRPVVGTCLAISALAVMAITSSTTASSKSAARPMQLEVVRQGKQPIVDGCANIYGSDPYQVFIDPDTGLRVLTAVFTICDDRSLNGVALNALGFDHNTDIDKGVSYVETGKGTWLTLYDGPNFNGKSVVISPLTEMRLKYVTARNWNDLTRSLTTRSTTGDGVALYLSHRVALGSVNDHCVALYNANPEVNPSADGLYLCGDPNVARKWVFSSTEIINQGFNIDGTYFGIKYIQTGRKVQLLIYDGTDNTQINGESLKVDGHDVLDLTTVAYGPNGVFGTWAGTPRSFTLIEIPGADKASF